MDRLDTVAARRTRCLFCGGGGHIDGDGGDSPGASSPCHFCGGEGEGPPCQACEGHGYDGGKGRGPLCINCGGSGIEQIEEDGDPAEERVTLALPKDAAVELAGALAALPNDDALKARYSGKGAPWIALFLGGETTAALRAAVKAAGL